MTQVASFAHDKTIQSFLLREKRRAFLALDTDGGRQADDRLIAAIQADLGQLGIALDGGIVAQLRGMGERAVVAAHKTLVTVAKQAVGDHVQYRPLFRNFPQDVPSDDLDYFIRRIYGYLESYLNLATSEHTVLSCGHVINHRIFDLDKFGACPVCQRQVPELDGGADARWELDELTPMKLLKLATAEDVWTVFDNVARAHTSLSPSQKEFLGAVIVCAPQEAARRLPAEMAFKENAAFAVAALLKAGCVDPMLFKHVKTATDVLRVAVGLCDGDVSLKETTRFKLSNPHRRFLMQAFEALPQKSEHILEEMLGYRGRWLRLGEVLHVGQFKRHCPKLAECFDVLRNLESSITTHASRVEALLNGGSLAREDVARDLLALLSQRPGEFARKVDSLLQRGMSAVDVVGTFEAVAAKVSTNILLTLTTHLRQRGQKAEFRAFMPKGLAAKMFISEGDARAPLSEDARVSLSNVVRSELLRRFSLQPALGKVYVSDTLANVLVPFSQRSASSGMAPMTRGSRMRFDAAKGFLRLFLNWKETSESGRIDVDLTCGLYGDDWRYLDHLSWTNLRSAGRSAHSGDVQSGSGPHGAAEFIDLDLQALKQRGVRYASVTVYSYTGQQFSQFPCFAGFMEREEPGRGKAFEAKTVVNKFDVTGDRMVMVPMFVDLLTDEVVWADMGIKGRPGYSIETAGGRVVQQHKAILAMGENRMSLKELFELHAKARGELVSSADEADLVLDDKRLLELDDIVANWL